MTRIHDLEALPRLPADPELNGLLHRQRLRLDLPGIPQVVLMPWQASFDRLQRRCGCAAGSVVLFIGLVLGILGIWLSGVPLISLKAAYMGVGTGVSAVIASLAAKLMVMVVSRHQFARLCTRCYRELSSYVQITAPALEV